MAQLLRVDASMRHAGSHSRVLADRLVDKINKKQSLSVIKRDLSEGVPMVDEAWIAANFTPSEERSSEHHAALATSDALVEELRASDVIVIALPIYNFGVPAAFKAWIDMVTRAKETFEYTATGPQGLLSGKTAYVIMTSGGTALGSPIDFVSPWLKHVLAFVGIENLQIIDASAVLFDEAGVLARAQAQIDELAQSRIIRRQLIGLMASQPQKSRMVLLFVALGVLLLLPVPDFVDDHYLLGILQNAGHAPGFAILTYGCLYLADARSPSGYARVVGLVLMFAVATEVLQHFTHRQFSVADIGSDVTGVAFALAAWLLRFDHRVRQTLWLRRLTALTGMAALVLMLAPPLLGLSTWLDRKARFPVLLEPDMANVLMMTASLGSQEEVDITLHPDRISVDLLAGPRPGLVIKDFVADWQGYEVLVIEVSKSGEGELFLELYVRDKASALEGSDWFFAHALIETEGWHQLRFTLDDIQNGPRSRSADLSQIAAIALHRRAGTASQLSIRKIYLQQFLACILVIDFASGENIELQQTHS